MSKILVIAEKPDQAKKIKEAIEPAAKWMKGFYEGNKYVITYAIGHLMTINKEEIFGKWSTNSQLPIKISNLSNPIENYEISKDKKSQMKLIGDLLKRKDIDTIIAATDYDNEGEGIYRTIIEYHSIKIKSITTKKQYRLIIKDLTAKGLKSAFENLLPIENGAEMRFKFYGRSMMDVMIGINLTRFYTNENRKNDPGSKLVLQIGRVQTVLLAAIYDRYVLKNEFKSTLLWKNVFNDSKVIDGQGFKIKFSCDKHIFENEMLAKEYRYNNDSKNMMYETKTRDVEPPALFSMDSLQVFCSEKFGMAPDQVLDVLQILYDGGMITYPRTDSKFLTADTADKLKHILRINKNIKCKAIGKVGAHEGLMVLTTDYNTGITSIKNNPNNKSKIQTLGEESFQKIFTLILKTSIIQFQSPTTVVDYHYFFETNGFKYTFKYSIIDKVNLGWFATYKNSQSLKVGKVGEYFITDVSKIGPYGYVDSRDINLSKETVSYKTTPLPLFTDATLIKFMQNINSVIQDEELKKVSKKNKGIGTPATRATIIKNLKTNGFISKKGKGYEPTLKGIQLIKELRKRKNMICDPQITAKMEVLLDKYAVSNDLEGFINTINTFISNEIKNN